VVALQQVVVSHPQVSLCDQARVVQVAMAPMEVVVSHPQVSLFDPEMVALVSAAPMEAVQVLSQLVLVLVLSQPE